jgi:hypothetical protein
VPDRDPGFARRQPEQTFGGRRARGPCSVDGRPLKARRNPDAVPEPRIVALGDRSAAALYDGDALPVGLLTFDSDPGLQTEATPGDEEQRSDEQQVADHLRVLTSTHPLRDGARHVEGHAGCGDRDEDGGDGEQTG